MSCPICRKPAVAAYRPFCSRRCADVDLGRWLTGGYAIPTEEGAEGDRERDVDRAGTGAEAPDRPPRGRDGD